MEKSDGDDVVGNGLVCQAQGLNWALLTGSRGPGYASACITWG